MQSPPPQSPAELKKNFRPQAAFYEGGRSGCWLGHFFLGVPLKDWIAAFTHRGDEAKG